MDHTPQEEPALGQSHRVVTGLQERVASQLLTPGLHLVHHTQEHAVVLVLLQALPQLDRDRVDVTGECREQSGAAVRVIIDSVPADNRGLVKSPLQGPLTGPLGGWTGEEEAGESV